MSAKGLLAITSKVTRALVLTVCIINDFINSCVSAVHVVCAQQLSYLPPHACSQVS